MKRKVISIYTHTRDVGYGKRGGSALFQLECGHEVTGKLSAGIPATKECRNCRHLSHGGTSTVGNVRETWDPETRTVIRTTI